MYVAMSVRRTCNRLPGSAMAAGVLDLYPCVLLCVWLPQLAAPEPKNPLPFGQRPSPFSGPTAFLVVLWFCGIRLSFFSLFFGRQQKIQQAQFDACNLSCIIFFEHIQLWTCYIILPQHSRHRAPRSRSFGDGKCRGVARQVGLLFIRRKKRPKEVWHYANLSNQAKPKMCCS